MKKIMSKSFATLQKSASAFKGSNYKFVKILGHPVRIGVEYTEYGTYYPGTHIDPPDHVIEKLEIDNLDDIIQELLHGVEQNEQQTLRDLGNNTYLHVISGKKYSKQDIASIVEDELYSN